VFLDQEIKSDGSYSFAECTCVRKCAFQRSAAKIVPSKQNQESGDERVCNRFHGLNITSIAWSGLDAFVALLK
jgi:hypothetical protein